MKLVEYASKWGNLYRLRYYLNGRRISDAAADALLKKPKKKVADERVHTDWRTTWEVCQ